jgi:hypothetical protein
MEMSTQGLFSMASDKARVHTFLLRPRRGTRGSGRTTKSTEEALYTCRMETSCNVCFMRVKSTRLRAVLINGTAEIKRVAFSMVGSRMEGQKKDMWQGTMAKNSIPTEGKAYLLFFLSGTLKNLNTLVQCQIIWLNI